MRPNRRYGRTIHDDLGIPWTQNAHHTIAVYRKAATARMDEFVGPKTAPRPPLT